MTAVPRYFNARRMFEGLDRRVATLERGQRTQAALNARIDDLEARVEALEDLLGVEESPTDPVPLPFPIPIDPDFDQDPTESPADPDESPA